MGDRKMGYGSSFFVGNLFVVGDQGGFRFTDRQLLCLPAHIRLAPAMGMKGGAQFKGALI
jgi:hypothetical protein